MPQSENPRAPPPAVSGKFLKSATSENSKAATRSIENLVAKSPAAGSLEVWKSDVFDCVPLSGLRPIFVGGGLVLCSYIVHASVADEEGKWHLGAIATVMDDIGIAAILSEDGEYQITVDFSISFFSDAKIGDEVEIEAKIVDRRGSLTMVAVELRHRCTGRLVAVSRQWVSILRSFHRSNM
ncbi:hypothetical protein KSP40_PGU021067 [Platanthera guangdongensis]|uniref:Thioesterase domain-containing protein n=1 Tax=Platanthera guangdongensis TaxID=2320717 RepID=A0ABR2LZI1_9ASPA